MNRRLFVSLMATGLMLTWAPILGAHPGHAKKVLGTVSVINGNHVEVKEADGKVSMHMLDGKTKIKRGSKILKASDVKVGDRVVLTVNEEKDKAGKAIVTVTEVQLSATPAAKPGAKQ